MYEIADYSLKLSPRYNHVPYILVDEEPFNGVSEGFVIDNMLKFVCKNYRGSKTIDSCIPYLDWLIDWFIYIF